MKIIKKFLIMLFFSIVLVSPAYADENISIQTKATYYFGEFLSFSVNVTEITGEVATFRIIDSNLKSSSQVNLEIKNYTTVVTAPFPFESSIFHEGKYTIEVQYSGEKARTDFLIMDSGKKLIPVVTKQVGSGWIDGVISDYEFTKFLIDQKIITISHESISNDVRIPSWVKTTTKWWTDGLVGDHDYMDGIQFLVNRGIINTESGF